MEDQFTFAFDPCEPGLRKVDDICLSEILRSLLSSTLMFAARLS